VKRGREKVPKKAPNQSTRERRPSLTGGPEKKPKLKKDTNVSKTGEGREGGKKGR